MCFDVIHRSRILRAFLVVLLSLVLPTVVGRLGTAELLTSKNFDAFVKKNPTALIDFYDSGDAQHHLNQKEYQSAARSLRAAGHKVPLAMVDSRVDEALALKYVPNKVYPQLLWFVNGDPSQYHRSLRTAEQVVSFVEALDRDPLTEISNEDEVFDFNPAVFCKFPKSSPMHKVLENVGSKHMDTLAFLWKPSSEINITFVAKDHPRDEYAGQADVKEVEKWVRDMVLRSEAAPNAEEAMDGASEIVVGSTFEEKVRRPDKDVVLLVHAPWCGFCRKFMPVWDEFAQKVSKIEHLAVAKMDGDRNSSPDPDNFVWAMFPTILYVRAGEQAPSVFKSSKSERTVERLIEFVREYSSLPVMTDDEL